MSNGNFPAYPVSNPANSSFGGGPQQNGMTYRQYLVAQLAPVALNAFFSHDAWSGYDEMAGSLMNAVDAILAAERETTE